MQGELFRAHAHIRPRRANFFARKARQRGDIETNNTTAHPQQGSLETGITSAPKNCTKNTHFAPAKAMAVSIPHGYKRAKAMAVSLPHRHKRAKAIAVSVPHGYKRAKAIVVSKLDHLACSTQLRCPWAVAGPGRASSRRAERSSQRGRIAGGPPPTGTPSSPARQGAPAPGTQQRARSAAAPRAPHSRVSVAHRLSWMWRPGTASISSRV